MNKSLAILSVAAVLLAGCYGLGAGVKLPPAEAEHDVRIEAGRSFLVGKEPEGEGYGLYSYLLFGSPATGANRPRYLAAIVAYLNSISRVADMEDYAPRSQLNVTYLFLTEPPPAQVAAIRSGSSSADEDAAAQWILDHYNYPRARAVLGVLPGTHMNGPYIVSYLKPLTGVKTVSGQYLYQDLSSASPELVPLWVKVFLAQSAQERYWEANGMQQVVVTLRQTISMTAQLLPDVRQSLERWITWVN